MDKFGVIRQPDPVQTNLSSANDLLVDKLGINHLLADDLLLRKQQGIKHYGILLTSFNGRDQAVDAYQELLDCLVYLEAKIWELKEEENIYKTFFFERMQKELIAHTTKLLEFLIEEKENNESV